MHWGRLSSDGRAPRTRERKVHSAPVCPAPSSDPCMQVPFETNANKTRILFGLAEMGPSSASKALNAMQASGDTAKGPKRLLEWRITHRRSQHEAEIRQACGGGGGAPRP